MEKITGTISTKNDLRKAREEFRKMDAEKLREKQSAINAQRTRKRQKEKQ